MVKTVKTSLTPFVLSHDIYAAIGEVAVSWSALETLVSSGLARMLRADYGQFIAVSANMHLSPQLDSAMTLAQMVVDKPHQKALVKILDSVRKMASERNKIVHGQWMQTTRRHIAVCINARAYAQVIEHRKLFTAAELRNFSKQIRTLGVDLTEAYIQAGLVVVPDPLPDDSKLTIEL